MEIGAAYGEGGGGRAGVPGYYCFLRREKYGCRYGCGGWRRRFSFPSLWGEGSAQSRTSECCCGKGADKISVNSAAIMNPSLIGQAADKFGSQCVVVAIDARKRADGSGWNIFKNGGRVDMGMDAVEWAMQAERAGGGRDSADQHGL